MGRFPAEALAGWSATPLTIRRSSSLALVRLLEPSTSPAAAAAILGHTKGFKNFSTMRQVLHRNGTTAQFSAFMHDVARVLASRDDRVDYPQRRAAFVSLSDLDAEVWRHVCEQAGIDDVAFQTWWCGRRQFAATWLWEMLTGGDWRHAPAVARERNADARMSDWDRVRHGHNAFCTYRPTPSWNGLHRVHEGLLGVGRNLLAAAGLDGPVTFDPLADGAQMSSAS